jgi:hypothetical protein
MIRFQINRDTVRTQISTEEWEAMERAQDGELRIYRLRPVLARFMVAEDGTPIPHAQALRELGKVPLEEFVTDVFGAFFKALQDTAVPKVSASLSSSPSEANMQA